MHGGAQPASQVGRTAPPSDAAGWASRCGITDAAATALQPRPLPREVVVVAAVPPPLSPPLLTPLLLLLPRALKAQPLPAEPLGERSGVSDSQAAKADPDRRHAALMQRLPALWQPAPHSRPHRSCSRSWRRRSCDCSRSSAQARRCCSRQGSSALTCSQRRHSAAERSSCSRGSQVARGEQECAGAGRQDPRAQWRVPLPTPAAPLAGAHLLLLCARVQRAHPHVHHPLKLGVGSPQPPPLLRRQHPDRQHARAEACGPGTCAASFAPACTTPPICKPPPQPTALPSPAQPRTRQRGGGCQYEPGLNAGQ